MQSPLQLAEISIGHVGALSKLAQRQLGRHPLRTQQRPERRKLGLGGYIAHADSFPLETARCPKSCFS